MENANFDVDSALGGFENENAHKKRIEALSKKRKHLLQAKERQIQSMDKQIEKCNKEIEEEFSALKKLRAESIA